jgi:hypothetical protein
VGRREKGRVVLLQLLLLDWPAMGTVELLVIPKHAMIELKYGEGE